MTPLDAVTTEPALSAEDVAALNAARKILDRVGRLHHEVGASYAQGLVASKADTAEHAVFQVLNFADTYLHLELTKAQLHEDAR